MLGTTMLSVPAGHKRYAHITALRNDGVPPELLGMEKIVSDPPSLQGHRRGRGPGMAAAPSRLLHGALAGRAVGSRCGFDGQALFGGRAWLLSGNLLCGARDDGMLVRLGKSNDGWALALPGIGPMIMRGRPMAGWVRAGPDAFVDDALRGKLLNAALAFVRTLPPK